MRAIRASPHLLQRPAMGRASYKIIWILGAKRTNPNSGKGHASVEGMFSSLHSWLLPGKTRRGVLLRRDRGICSLNCKYSELGVRVGMGHGLFDTSLGHIGVSFPLQI